MKLQEYISIYLSIWICNECWLRILENNGWGFGGSFYRSKWGFKLGDLDSGGDVFSIAQDEVHIQDLGGTLALWLRVTWIAINTWLAFELAVLATRSGQWRGCGLVGYLSLRGWGFLDPLLTKEPFYQGDEALATGVVSFPISIKPTNTVSVVFYSIGGQDSGSLSRWHLLPVIMFVFSGWSTYMSL